AEVAQPDCNLYPTTERLYPIEPDGMAFFARERTPSKARYVFVVTFSFADTCSAIASYPDGSTQSILELSSPSTVFVPGTFENDRVLGSIWYTDSGGGCTSSVGPPPEWCGR